MAEILKINNLSIHFDTPEGEVCAVRGVDLCVQKGEIFAIVGESGCGKTVLCQSVMKLLPKNAVIVSGTITVDGIEITNCSEKEMRNLRGNLFSMIFQDPMTTLNPTMPIGKQIAEAVLNHHKMTKDAAKARALELLDLIGIDDPVVRYEMQPHFFSGGMRQRCVLAIALASSPKILFADEPTTALDVTVQAKILDLLLDLRDKLDLTMVFVSHDLGVVARIADRVAIMYAGKIVEIGLVEEIFYDPRHPYTWGLMQSLPSLAQEGEPLRCIPGMPPVMLNPPEGDLFAYRNEFALQIDYEEMPPFFAVSSTHSAATWLLDPRAPQIPSPVSLRPKERENP